MSDEPIEIKLSIPTGGNFATLHFVKQSGGELAHATFTVPQLRQLVVDLARVLTHLEHGAVPPPSLKVGEEGPLPLPTPLTAWRVGGLDTGEPVIAAELYPGLWVSFSLSIEDGQKLADTLHQRLALQRLKAKT